MLYIVRKLKRNRGKDNTGSLEPIFLAAACHSDQNQNKGVGEKRFIVRWPKSSHDKGQGSHAI